VNPVFILIVVIGILSSIASKKRKAEASKKAHQPPSFPQRGSTGQGPRPSSPTAANRQAKPSNTAPSQNNRKPSPAVDSKWPWPTAAERAQNKPQPAASSKYGGTPRYTHVVTSTLEGGHTHTESSMTGEESCPPPKPVAQKRPEAEPIPASNAGALLSFQTNSVLQGVLYAEILGKPKALQRK